MDPVPKKKPITREKFEEKVDLYMQGLFGGMGRELMLPLLNKVYQEAKDAGVVTPEEAYKYAQDKSNYYKDLNMRQQMRAPFAGGGSRPRTDLEFENLTRKQLMEERGTGPKNTAGFKNLPGEDNIIYTDYKNKKTGETIRKYGVRIRSQKDNVQKILTTGEKFRNIDSLEEAKKIRDDFREVNPKNIKPRDPKKVYATKERRGARTKEISSRSVEDEIRAKKGSGKHLHHAAFRNSLADLKNLMYIDEASNVKMTKLFEDPLLKEMEDFTKVFDDPNAATKEKQKAATKYLKNDRALRQKYPEFKNFKTRLSFRRTALDPSGIMFKEKLPDPSLAISNEPGMRLKGETPKSPRGKEIVRKAAEKFGSYAKPISKVALRAIGPFIPIAGTAATALGVADVAEAAEQGLRDESLGIAYLLGPEKAKQYSEFKGRIKGKEDDTEAFVP